MVAKQGVFNHIGNDPTWYADISANNHIFHDKNLINSSGQVPTNQRHIDIARKEPNTRVIH
jgi:hypothetical protein